MRSDTHAADGCCLPGGATTTAGMRLWTSLFLFVVATGILVFVVSPAALGQADYAGIPPPPTPADPYVGAYVGPPPPGSQTPGGGGSLTASPPLGGSGGEVSVTSAALDDPVPVADADGRLVTGSDLATIAALGLGAAVAFAVLTGRFRSI